MSAPNQERYLPWALLGGLGWFFVFADRAVLSPLLHIFGLQFHVGPGKLGLISSVFFLTYTFVQIPVGHMADRVSPRTLLGVGYVGFGLFIALTGAASSYPALLGLSALAGTFQGVYYPTQFAVTARRIPPAALPVANAVITSGMGAGIAGGYLIASTLAPSDWRLPVLLLGLLTVGVGLWLYLVTPHDIQRPRAEAAALPAAAPSARRFALLLAINFCSLYPFFFMLAWLPYDLGLHHGLQGVGLGVAASLPTIVAIPATILWNRRPAAGRLERMRWLLAAAALSLLAMGIAGGTWVLLLALVVYGVCGKLVLDPMILSEVALSLRGEQYGKAYGTMNFVGMLASVAAPALGGILVQHFGSFSDAFVVAALILLIALALSLGLHSGAEGGPAPRAKTPTVATEGGGLR